MNDRIREVRQSDRVNLSRAAFGERIGVSGDVINNIERGRVDVKEHIIKLICSEFHVNEEWLREGSGEMFVERSYFSLDDYAESKNLSELDKEVIKNFMELDPDTRHAVYDVIIKAFATSETDPEAPAADPVKEAEEAYIKSRSASARNTDSSASNTA